MSIQQGVPLVAEVDEHVKRQQLVTRLHSSNRIANGILLIMSALVVFLFVGIIVYLLVQGGPALINTDFYGSGSIGILGEIFNTFYILILTQIFLFPLSLAAAIYLVEYARQGLLVKSIHFAAETLAGVPSIVLGMFGVLLFSTTLHFGTSRMAGALTLLCLNMPVALRLFEDALSSVPRELREGGLALGSTKWHTIRTIVIPSALPGLVTGLIISAGRIIGEAAALIFTMGIFNPGNVFTLNPSIASDTLTTRLYYLKGPGGGTSGLTFKQEIVLAAGIAAILILLLLLLNVGARLIGRAIQRRITAE